MLKQITSLISYATLVVVMVGGLPAQAEVQRQGSYNIVDTDTNLEWRTSLPNNTNANGYEAILSEYEADSTYRYPTAAEVADLLDKLFPNFVANDASGRCAEIRNYTGGYPELVAEAQAFFTLLGDYSPDTGRFEGLYEDASGTLRALYVDLFPGSNQGNTATLCLTGRYTDYEGFRTPNLPSTSTKTLVVREAVDRTAETLTVFNYLSPGEVGLYLGEDMLPHMNECVFEDYVGAYGDDRWRSVSVPGFFCWYDNNQLWTIYVSHIGAGRAAPAAWMKLKSLEYKDSYGCSTGDTDLGDNWCRRTFADTGWYFTGESVTFPDTMFVVDAIDNIVIEQIWENADIDFQPFDDSNEVRPKEAYFITVKVNTTSTADGDAYDLNAADIDPLSLRLGYNNAELVGPAAVLSDDYDNDGDIDFIYGFRMEDTGATCFDDSIRLSGTTYSGDPIVGHDVFVPTACEETVDIDVDPFNATNIIRPNDNYNITVALLGMRASVDGIDFFPERERTLLPWQYPDGLDRATLKLGPAGTSPVGTPIITDIDGDAFDDLLVSFNVYDAGIACGDTQLEITGNKNSGIPIEGVDNIVTEDCTVGCHP